MATNPYVVRLAHPEDCVTVHGSAAAKLEVRDITIPVDFTLKDEITMMMFHEISDEKLDIGYHMHTQGTETFIPVAGKIEIVCNGYHTVMEPGDIVHIEPYMSHSFRAIEPHSAMMCLFKDFNMIKLMDAISAASKNCPGFMADPVYHEMYSKKAHKIDRKVPDPIEAPKDQIPCLIEEGKGKFEYNFPGLQLLLKVGMWQTEYDHEMWEANMAKGAKLIWGERRPDYRLFHLTKGAIRLTVDGEETIVNEEAIIHLPPFAPFAIEALEDTKIYDLDCPDNLASFLEDLGDLSKKQWPSDPDKLKEFMANYYITVTEYQYNK